MLNAFITEFPSLIFETIPKRINNIDKIIIIAHSPDQEYFLKPQKFFDQLFTPQITKFESHEFVFVYKFNAGLKILE